jgi:hypothetical protein
MNASTRFHDLTVAAVRAEAGEAVVIRFAVPDALRDVFAFEPGQFITLRADVNGAPMCAAVIRFAARRNGWRNPDSWKWVCASCPMVCFPIGWPRM